MSDACHTLFVYGTLRPRCRHPMAAFLAERGAYRGEAKVAGQYTRIFASADIQ